MMIGQVCLSSSYNCLILRINKNNSISCRIFQREKPIVSVSLLKTSAVNAEKNKKCNHEADIQRKMSNFKIHKPKNVYFSKPNFFAADLR
jgi:hypothetical protein